MTTPRLFIAINLDDAVRDAADAALAPVRETVGRGVRWTPAGQLHLTLKFLGEQPVERREAVESAVRETAARHRAFATRIVGAGAFPNLRRPRVVWLGVEPDPRLELLHHDVETTCAALGYEVDGRAFRPHLTVGRVRDDAPAAALDELRRAIEALSLDLELSVDTLDLMGSILHPEGARHERLVAAPLRDDD